MSYFETIVGHARDCQKPRRWETGVFASCKIEQPEGRRARSVPFTHAFVPDKLCESEHEVEVEFKYRETEVRFEKSSSNSNEMLELVPK